MAMAFAAGRVRKGPSLWFSHLMRTCPHCHRPLIEIDYYGERLIGCVECNVWGRSGNATLPMQLPEHDLEALRARSRG